MTQQKIPSQWQLQNTGEPADQWMLRDDEQQLPAHLQLQDESPGPALIETNWQPIDYQAMQQAAQRPRRGGVAVTALVVLVLLGVGSYLTWFYLGQPGLGVLTDTTNNSETPAAVTPAVEAPAAAAAEPTPMGAAPAPAAAATVAAPTQAAPPPSPTPVLIEVRQATVDSQYGVNLRETANSTSTLVRVLESGTTHLVVSGPVTDAEGNAWYELASSDGTRGWAAGGFVRIASQVLPYDQAAALYRNAQLDPPVLPVEAAAVASQVADTNATSPITDTASMTGSQVVPSLPLTSSAVITVENAIPASAAPAVTLTGVISAPAGLNLRTEPVTGDNVIQMLDDKAAVTVIGRSQDGQWTQVELADKRRGWLSAPFVVVTGDINSIPLGTAQPLTPTVSASASTAPVAADAAAAPTSVATTVAPPTGVAAAGGLGTVIVTSVLGVNVRPQPLNEATPLAQLDWNATTSALGRTADSKWVQVQLQDGRTGWVKASAVSVANGLALLPVTQ